MPPALLPVEELPQRPATQVKNSWAPMVREVQASGCLAITNHSTVEAVLLSVNAYETLLQQAAHGRESQQRLLDDLTSRFKQRLETLTAPDLKDRVDSLFKSQGKVPYRSKAGASY